MQVNIDLLDLRTVDKALKQIEEYQKKVRELIPVFLKRCAEAVRDLANQKLTGYGYSGELISEIQNSWSIDESKDGVVTLINSHDKAVYIEFGTGIVGSGKSHEMASESGYKYDYNGHGEKGWRFIRFADGEDIDLPDGRYTETKGDHTGMWFLVHTSGAPATMFLYQAASDFADYKLYKRIWNDLVKGK